MKKLSVIFGTLAVLLSDMMCAVAAYHYCDLLWGKQLAGYSAPAGAAFVYAIPYAIAILISVVLAIVFRKKAAKQQAQIHTALDEDGNADTD